MNNPTTALRSEINRLRKALRDLVAMNMRLDPTDEDRREMQAAIVLLKRAEPN